MGSGSVSGFFFFLVKPLGGANTTVQAVSTFCQLLYQSTSNRLYSHFFFFDKAEKIGICTCCDNNHPHHQTMHTEIDSHRALTPEDFAFSSWSALRCLKLWMPASPWPFVK